MLGNLFVYIWGSLVLGHLIIIAVILNKILKELKNDQRLDYFNDDYDEEED